MAPTARCTKLVVFFLLQMAYIDGARVKTSDEETTEGSLSESEVADVRESEVADVSESEVADHSESESGIGDEVTGKVGDPKLDVLINGAKKAVVTVEFPEVKKSSLYIACKAVTDDGTCGHDVCSARTGGAFPINKHCNEKSQYRKMVCCNKVPTWLEKGYFAADQEDPKQRAGDIVSGKVGKPKLKVLINAAKNAYVDVELLAVKKTNLRVECTAVRDTGTCGNSECSKLTGGQFIYDEHCNTNSSYGKMVCCRKARGWERIGDIVAGNRGNPSLRLQINAPHHAFVDVSFPEVKETGERIECKATTDTGKCGDAVCSEQTEGQFTIDKHCNTNSKYGKMVCCRKV